MRFAKVTLYVAVQDYVTSVENGPPQVDALDYVMPALHKGLEDDPDVTLLDYYSEDMRLVPAERS
jgi:hypothetical protein